jgi:hypothetical protein
MTPSQWIRPGMRPRIRIRMHRPAAALVAVGLSFTWLVAAPSGAHAAPAAYHRACPPATPGYATCFALYRTGTGQAQPNVTTPDGYGPADLQSAYQWPSSTGGVGRVVAVVDAFDLPEAEADMNHYRAQFGIPACTTNNGCFIKLNQSGNASPLPAPNNGWGVEIALDLQMVSASCPNCAIALIEAANNSTDNLAAAAQVAAGIGAAVTNSYGSPEASDEHTHLDPDYSVPGVVYTAASGDAGYGPGPDQGAQYPASSPDVVAVGGTRLTQDASARGWNEKVWYNGGAHPQGTNSGCSLYESKPVWQSGIPADCTTRTEVDVSAVADPNTGVAVYGPFDGITTPATPSWGVVGGTSASSPLIAGAYMLAGGSPVKFAGRLAYDREGANLNDVTVGSNTATCTDGNICMADTGYDGPTGMGTPNGVSDLRSIAGVGELDRTGSTDLSVYRPSTRQWFVRGSHVYPEVWGVSGDIPVPADYLGDSFADAAIWRPSTHRWWIQSLPSLDWGITGDIPAPADFNGDGRADPTVFRPSNGTWYEHGVGTVRWGINGDVPVPGDYNGDGKADPAVFRPSNSTWYVNGGAITQWGIKGDIPVPGDYNGDGKTDIAVYRPSTQRWWIDAPGVSTPTAYGSAGDIPQPGDYNGDGKTDIAVWRPSTTTWLVQNQFRAQWGASGDVPLNLPYAISRKP